MAQHIDSLNQKLCWPCTPKSDLIGARPPVDVLHPLYVCRYIHADLHSNYVYVRSTVANVCTPYHVLQPHSLHDAGGHRRNSHEHTEYMPMINCIQCAAVSVAEEWAAAHRAHERGYRQFGEFGR